MSLFLPAKGKDSCSLSPQYKQAHCATEHSGTLHIPIVTLTFCLLKGELIEFSMLRRKVSNM